MVGPTLILHFPDNKVLSFIGLVVMSYFDAILIIPVIPEAIDAIQHRYKIIEGINEELDERLCDIMGSMMQMSITLAGLLGPILGTVFYEYLAPDEPNNFRYANDVLMVQMGVFSMLFVVCNCGCNIMQKDRIIR